MTEVNQVFLDTKTGDEGLGTGLDDQLNILFEVGNSSKKIDPKGLVREFFDTSKLLLQLSRPHDRRAKGSEATSVRYGSNLKKEQPQDPIKTRQKGNKEGVKEWHRWLTSVERG